MQVLYERDDCDYKVHLDKCGSKSSSTTVGISHVLKTVNWFQKE
jgi:hypothetical protein